jgi:hypothetical protein
MDRTMTTTQFQTLPLIATLFYQCIAMEQFFTPARRHQEQWESLPQPENAPREYNEVELSVPVEEFLNYGWDWKDLCAFMSCDAVRKTIWITKDAFIAIRDVPTNFSHDPFSDRMIAMIKGTSGQEQLLILAHVDHPGISLEEASVFWRAITTSNCVNLEIGNVNANRVELPSGPLLSQFLRESPSLQVLQLRAFDFKEEHCRALVAVERTDLEVLLTDCKLDPQDAEDTFVEWFRHNQILTKLDCCQMGCRILSALSGNKSVNWLTIESHFSEDQMCSLIEAIPGNMGIEALNTSNFLFNDETWILLFRSLSTHSRIRRMVINHRWCTVPTLLSAASKTKRMNAIIEMLYLNTAVDTIDLAANLMDEEMYQNSIFPRLLLNRSWFDAQIQAVKLADPAIRPKLLGRALHKVRYNPDLVFMFLSENIPAFV